MTHSIRRLRNLAFIGLLWMPCAFAAPVFINPDTEAARNAPYSHAVIVDNLMILSGQVGVGPSGLVEGGIVPESHQIMRNIEAILAGQGASFEDIVKCTVMIDEISEWGAFNEVYVTYFPGAKPARSAFGADGLAFGAAVELECWAYLGD